MLTNKSEAENKVEPLQLPKDPRELKLHQLPVEHNVLKLEKAKR